MILRISKLGFLPGKKLSLTAMPSDDETWEEMLSDIIDSIECNKWHSLGLQKEADELIEIYDINGEHNTEVLLKKLEVGDKNSQ